MGAHQMRSDLERQSDLGRDAGKTPLVVRDCGLPKAAGLYDPAQRARCLRRRLRRQHQGPEVPRDRRRTRLQILRQPRPSRRGRRRPACRRRRRHPDPDPATRSSRKTAAKLGVDLPEPGHYAVGHIFLPRDAAGAGQGAGDRRPRARRRGPDPARLARRADRQPLPRRERHADRAGPPPGSSSAAPKDIADQDDFERQLFVARKEMSNAVYGMRRPEHRRLLPGVAVVPHHRLQGPAAGRPGRRLLPGPAAIRDFESRRWRWCTSASRPTPSRRGSWPIPTGSSPTTARSTRCAATSTGWRRARRSVESELFGADSRQDVADHPEGQSDTACLDNALELLVRGRLLAGPRDDDADPGGVGRQSADG